jgi:alkylated DNA repair dioxygenase AlkB
MNPVLTEVVFRKADLSAFTGSFRARSGVLRGMSRLPETVLLEGQTRVTYLADYLPAGRADALLTWCLDRPWESETYSFSGKPVATRRKSCAFGAPGMVYRYAGVTREAFSLLPALGTLVEGPYNFVLANLYPDGKAAIGAHADDEEDIVPGSPIAALSLGQRRTFVLTHKDGQRAAEVTLGHGSLLVMEGDTQQRFKHCVPRQPRLTLPRVSLTFRQLVSR